MTIIAGFYCKDGVLLCSDTEQSYSDSKSQVSKLAHFREGDSIFTVGGAGDGALADYVMQDLPKHLKGKSYSPTNIESILSDYAHATFKKHIQVYSGFPKEMVPQSAFLIGAVVDKHAFLFKWESNFLYTAGKNCSIGVGNVYADDLANVIDVGYSFESMILFAVRMLLRVKQAVTGCGGYTEFCFLRHDGAIVSSLSLATEIEHFVEQMDDLMATQLISFVSDTRELDEAQEEHMLDGKKRLLKTLREKYRSLIPLLSSKP